MSIFYKASGCPLSKVRLDDSSHQALLEQAIAAPSISNAAIADVLFEKWGISVSADTVGKHRMNPQKCSCRNIPKELT